MSMPVRTRSQTLEESENFGRNPSRNPTLGDLIATRFGRRDVLKGSLGATVIASLIEPLALMSARAAPAQDGTHFSFHEVSAGIDDKHYVAEGYDADVLIRWGDPVAPHAPAFDPTRQTAAAQKLQFGYNNDFLGYLPMPGVAAPARHGLLVVTMSTPTRN
jgi:uncharacterized protein